MAKYRTSHPPIFFFCPVRASSPKLVGACYERETHRKREGERNTTKRKSRDRAPIDFSLLRLVVGYRHPTNLSPLSSYTPNEFPSFWLAIVNKSCTRLLSTF